MLRLGERPDPEQNYTKRPGAYAVVLRGSDVLMTIEDNGQTGPEIQIPGGGIDPGEHPIAALHREVMEETGWRINVSHKMGVYKRFCYMPEYDLWAEKICHIYVATPVLKYGAPLESHHSVIWTKLENLVELITNPTDGVFIAENMHLL